MTYECQTRWHHNNIKICIKKTINDCIFFTTKKGKETEQRGDKIKGNQINIKN